MTKLIELAPQIGVALTIVAAVILMLRQVTSMAQALTRPGENGGKRESRIEAIDNAVASNVKLLQSHSKMHRKQFAAISTLQKGQTELLEHLTNGLQSSVDPIPEDIDAADTGEFFIPSHDHAD